MNLFDALVRSADAHPDRPAFTHLPDGRRLTYRALVARTEAFVAHYRSAGVQAGHRIALLAPDGLDHVPAAFAILALGACVVPIAPSLRPAERDEILSGTDVHAVAQLTIDDDAAALAWIDRDRSGIRGFDALDAAFIRFSSGTTAARKGVILSHRAVAARVAAAGAVLRLTPDDRVLWVLPLAYHFAVTIVSYVAAGAHVFLAGDLAPAHLAAAVDTHRATLLYASPLHFERLANAAGGATLRTVRHAISTTAALPATIAARFTEVFDRPLGQAYGIIEAGLPCINLGDGTFPSATVGPPVPGYEVTIRSDDGTVASPGVHGEVLVRGLGLFDGYYAPPQALSEVLADGWFHTGDVGALDKDGALTLHGRTKSTIVVAGMKVFPEEVEAILNAQPGVRESRVFGVLHGRLGEVPRAEVVAQPDGPPPDPRALAAALAARLSPYKLPLGIRVVASIEKTAGGKILRRPARSGA